MQLANPISPEYIALLDFIENEIRLKGFKATTMDSIAAGFKISKRTLYEIFTNKDEMIRITLKHTHNKIALKYSEIFASSSNIMEAILLCFLFNRDIIGKTNPDFFKDFHNFIKLSNDYSGGKQKQFFEHLEGILKKGVDEGYFRKDLKVVVQCQMITLQMESLRRLEELFPENMTIVEVFDSIIITFLRGISTTKGIKTLDKILSQIK